MYIYKKLKETLDDYDLCGMVRLFLSFLYTKLFYTKSRLIRIPFYIRGKKFIDLGKNFTAGFGCRLDAFPSDKRSIVLKFGENIHINDYVHIGAIKDVYIGNDVLIASKVYISDHNHGSYSGDFQDNPDLPPNNRKLYAKPVYIDDNVWIGEFVSILPGVRIGKGSVIGSMSVVTKNIPEYSIAVGSPAKVIKRYNFSSGIWEKI